MRECVMFTDDYAKTLPEAPRVFKVGELIDSADMPTPAGLWGKLPGFLGVHEIEPQDGPQNVTWRVVMVFQLRRSGGGYIRARSGWGTDNFLVEWHFRANAGLVLDKP